MGEEINEQFVFRRDTVVCSFCLETKENEVLLNGEEAENGKTTFRLVLTFSRELAKEAKQFARILCETETHPRVMAELAEEYFADVLPK